MASSTGYAYSRTFDALSRLCENHMPPKQVQETQKVKTATLSALQSKQHLSNEVYDKIAAVHNSSVGHWGQAKCRLKPDQYFSNPRQVVLRTATHGTKNHEYG